MAIFSKVIKKVFGSKSEKDLKKLYPYINKINDEFNLLSNISDDELKKKFSEISDNLTLIIKDKKEEFIKQKLDDNKIDEMLYDVEQNYLEILVYDYHNSTVSGADVRIKDNSNVVYSTSYYDGDDATTDDNGLISLIPLTYTIYEYGEDPTTNVTTVEVYYRISNVSRTVNMSTSHTENFSMPFGPGPDGMPFSVELVGAAGADHHLLAVARILEGLTR